MRRNNLNEPMTAQKMMTHAMRKRKTNLFPKIFMILTKKNLSITIKQAQCYSGFLSDCIVKYIPLVTQLRVNNNS